MNFDTLTEAQQKLLMTTIMYGPDPVKVVGISGNNNRVELDIVKYGEGSNIERRRISDPLFSVKDLGQRLGYINVTHYEHTFVTYSRRTPIRRSQTTQGLSDSNVRINRIMGNAGRGVPGHQYRFSGLETRGIKETLEQKYPSLSQVRYRMSKNETILELAFGHSLAVAKDMKGLFKLKYKDNDIGWSDDLETFHVSQEWQYLDRLFDESGMKIRSIK